MAGRFTNYDSLSSAFVYCANCHMKNATLCNGCKTIGYCSIVCQKMDWKNHFKDCDPGFKLNCELDQSLSHFVARRDVKRGETIVCMQTAALSPHDKGFPSPETIGICLGCSKRFYKSTHSPCSGCKGNICSDDCEKKKFHTELECQILSNVRNAPPKSIYFDSLLIIRTLMLIKVDPLAWEKLIFFLNRVKDNKRSEKHQIHSEKILNFLVKECKILIIFPELTSKKLFEYMVLFDATTVTGAEKCLIFYKKPDYRKRYFVSVKYILPAKLLLKESCLPNCYWVYSYAGSHVKLVASVDIPAGSDFETSFNSYEVFGTIPRRRLLNKKYYTNCICRRCTDPTELGSNFSAIKCQFCQSGHMLPIDPIKETTLWSCNSCKRVKPGKEVLEFTAKMNNEIKNCNDNEAKLWKVISEYENTQVHPNHYLLIKCYNTIMKNYWSHIKVISSQNISMKHVLESNQIIERLLEVHSLISPGDSIQAGRLLFLRQLFLCHIFVKDSCFYFSCTDDTYNLLHLIRKSQMQSENILKNIPFGNPEFEMRMLQKEIIVDQDDILSRVCIKSPLPIEVISELGILYSKNHAKFNQLNRTVHTNKWQRQLEEFRIYEGPFCRTLFFLDSDS